MDAPVVPDGAASGISSDLLPETYQYNLRRVRHLIIDKFFIGHNDCERLTPIGGCPADGSERHPDHSE